MEDLTATYTSFNSTPYKNHIIALSVRKSDRENGMNSTLFVRTTRLFKVVKPCMESDRVNKYIQRTGRLKEDTKKMILTIMVKGAAKTLTEKATQTHPRTRMRVVPFAKNWEKRRIKQNPPIFNRRTSLNVKICNPSANVLVN